MEIPKELKAELKAIDVKDIDAAIGIFTRGWFAGAESAIHIFGVMFPNLAESMREARSALEELAVELGLKAKES